MNQNDKITLQQATEMMQNTIGFLQKQGFEVKLCLSVLEKDTGISSQDCAGQQTLFQPKVTTDTGMVCPDCGSTELIQTGSCLTCHRCGTSVGGC